MKCSRCGYYNLPGATICGQCSQGLAGDAWSDHETFYPARARERNFMEQLRAHFALLRRPKQPNTIVVAMSRIPVRQIDWAFPIWAIGASIPGLLQLTSGRFVSAALLLLGTAALLLGAVIGIHSVVSDVLLLGIFTLSLISIYEAASYRKEATMLAANKRQRYVVQMSCAAVCVVSLIAPAIWLAMSSRYSMFVINTSRLTPTLEVGDTVISRRARTVFDLHHGQVVILHVDGFVGAPRIGVITHLPGDHVSPAADRPPEQDPGETPAYLVPRSAGVAGTVSIQPLDTMEIAEPVGAELSADPSQIEILQAVLSPPAHRKWFSNR